MLRLTKKMRFALEAVVDIAYNARPEPVQSREITKRQGIPQRYLEQVMQQLVHANILKGVRGPRGGYTLARERRRISVGEIIRVIGDSDDNDPEKMETVSALGQTVINPLWDEMQTEMMRRFDDISIEDLCKRADALRIAPEQRRQADFNI
ncbi:MAG: Rrf2 family transcriptional regulator [Alphaproteobacteria bacterium]|nr:Rrf2 family transcriptional regulator [Alphaproteobacteria bacterium]